MNKYLLLLALSVPYAAMAGEPSSLSCHESSEDGQFDNFTLTKAADGSYTLTYESRDKVNFEQVEIPKQVLATGMKCDFARPNLVHCEGVKMVPVNPEIKGPNGGKIEQTLETKATTVTGIENGKVVSESRLSVSFRQTNKMWVYAFELKAKTERRGETKLRYDQGAISVSNASENCFRN